MRVRWVSAVAATVFAASLVLGAAPATAAAVLPCSEYPVTVCDSDGDGITDLVESAICGTATCATGTEDTDADGAPDAASLQRMLDGGGPAGPVQFAVVGNPLVRPAMSVTRQCFHRSAARSRLQRRHDSTCSVSF